MTVTDEDRKAGQITDADIEAIADNDPVWAVADRIVYENHGVGNAAVIIKRYAQAAYAAGLERAAVIVDSGMFNEYGRPQPTLATAIRAEKEKV